MEAKGYERPLGRFNTLMKQEVEDMRWVDEYGTLHTGLQIYNRLEEDQDMGLHAFVCYASITICGQFYRCTRGARMKATP